MMPKETKKMFPRTERRIRKIGTLLETTVLSMPKEYQDKDLLKDVRKLANFKSPVRK